MVKYAMMIWNYELFFIPFKTCLPIESKWTLILNFAQTKGQHSAQKWQAYGQLVLCTVSDFYQKITWLWSTCFGQILIICIVIILRHSLPFYSVLHQVNTVYRANKWLVSGQLFHAQCEILIKIISMGIKIKIVLPDQHRK